MSSMGPSSVPQAADGAAVAPGAATSPQQQQQQRGAAGGAPAPAPAAGLAAAGGSSQQQQQGATAAAAAAALRPRLAPVATAPLQGTARPPLPRPFPPSSATSSRASSPRSSISAQPSLQTINMNRLAQYRAASRTFKVDTQPRKGLSNGDVVAFKSQGKLLAAVELGTDPAEASTVHFALQSVEQAADAAAEKLAHLEVIRQGKWLGFRSAAAGDRFLQARKRSPNRLVFFSQNVGTWEQWELAAGGVDPDAADWASLALTLRHRRLPQFELAVEVVRVGTVSMPPNAAITPRTLLAPGTEQAGAVTGGEEDATMERRELKRMSGVLVHEWLHYVDQEKAARLAIEARVAQMAEDAAGLRDWAVMQVESVRQEMGEEVAVLLETIKAKSAKLADLQTRLTGRLRWGVAMIQAKSELNMKRQIFMWWRWIAARKKYCRHVEAKLQQRSNLRLQGRVLQGWVEYRDHQLAVQEKLRVAVRRMYYVKLHYAFTAWQDLVACKRQQAAEQAALVEAVCQHMQRWRLRRLLRGWQQHAAGCCQGRQMLERMASQADQRLVVTVFGAWRSFVAQQQERVASFSALVAVRQRQQAQQQAFQGWRLLVDDEYGARLQLQHAQQVLARLRLRHVFGAWREWQQQRADRRERWEATIAYMQQRGAALRVDAAFAAWQDYVAYQKEKRTAFYNAVQHMALRKMAVAFQYWRYLTAYRQHARSVVEQSVVRLSQRAMANAFAAWQEYVTEQRTARHRIAMCQRRQQLSVQRCVLAAWRQVAALKGAERQIVQLCQKRADRNRIALALAAFQANADDAARRREQDHVAVSCYANSLQGKAFAALAEAVARRRLFEQQLAAVAQAVQQGLVREAFSGWRSTAALSTSATQLVAAAQRRFARMRLQNCLLAWRSVVEHRQQQEARLQRHLRQRAVRVLGVAFAGWQQVVERQQDLQQRLEVGVERIAQMRMAWALEAWRHTAAASAAERRLVVAGQRRVARVKLAAALAGWQQHTADMAAARQAAQQMAASRDASLLQDCLLGWAEHAAQRAQRQEAIVQLVQRRATWMSLNVLHFWRAYVAHKQQQRAQLARAVRKLSMVCQRHALATWRQQVAWQRAEAARLAVAERRIAARHAARTLAATFRGWRSHTATLAAARAAVDAKVQAEGAVVVRHALAAWCSHTEQQAERRDHILRVCVARQCTALQSKALVAWQLYAERQAHNREVVEVMVHRMARRLMHAALLTWRQAAQERKVRRTAIARFIQRWDAHRKAAALSHWRLLLAEKREVEDNLRRCLTRKRVAFRLFRQWYWESFDDDMQETLRTMFEITEGAALDPLPSQAASPYGSLLSSPVRQQLYGMPRQQQQRLTAGVAEALARPGGMQPAFMHSADQQQDSGSMYGGSGHGMGGYASSLGLGLPQLPQRESLSARLAAAAAAGSHGASSTLPARSAPPANLGGTALAPLRDFAAFTMHNNAMLEPVPEVAESPYMARSPAPAGLAGDISYSPSSGNASSTASTALQASPLTPASAYAAGGSPLTTSVGRLATPGSVSAGAGQHLSPGGLSAAATPGAFAGGLSAAATPMGAGALVSPHLLSAEQQRQQLYVNGAGGSPLVPLSAAATPAYSLASTSRGQLPGSVLRSPLSYAGTPQPDFGMASPAAAGYQAAAAYEAASPGSAQKFVDALTPGAHLGLQAPQFEVRRFSDGTEYVAPMSPGLASEYSTPLGIQKTPPPGLAELQGDYSIRRFDMAAVEGQQLVAQATPQPDGLIGAFPDSVARGGTVGGPSDALLSSAKTPMLHVNPLAMSPQ